MHRKLALPLLAFTAACHDGGVGPKTPDTSTPYKLAVNLTCATATPLAMAVGDVRQVGADALASLCLSSGAGSEYALMPVYTLGDPSKPITLVVSSSGTDAASASPSVAGSAPMLSIASAGGERIVDGSRFTRNAAFDARLREDERTLFRQRAAAARASYAASRAPRTGGALFSVAAAVPTVGSLISLNTNATNACASPQVRTGRVVAVTKSAVLVADTLNPANGFTSADFASIGADFDTLAYVVDTTNFGKPADIDLNGDRAIIFFTSTVNDLTPKNSTSVVGGFFYGRDLYPKTKTGGFDACAGSNYAELFYTLVPDPARALGDTTDPFSRERAKRLTVSVLAHEFQHLINLSRRLYVNNSPTDEDTWLNEGLSHVAEELVFFRSSGFAPRSNITAATLTATSQRRSAFNQFESSNFGRLNEYLPSPEENSPIADNDSLATRGATWQLLRYSADRKAGAERDTWFPLVNSQTHGLANLQTVFGTAAFGGDRPWLRDWAVSNFTDDAGFAVATQYTQPSWNFRDVFPAVTKGTPYPLLRRQLVSGSPVTVKLAGGAGVSYLKFKVNAAGGAATPAATLPTGLDLVLVRTK